jgi:hypothetical protein
VSNGAYPPDGSSIVQIRDAQTTYPSGAMVRTTPIVQHLEFISKDFGFLLACSPENSSGDEGNNERPVSSLVQLALNGEHRIIVENIEGIISSVSLSSDHQSIAVCTNPQLHTEENAKCRVFLLPDCREVSQFCPEKTKQMTVEFVGTTKSIFLWATSPGEGTTGFLVESGSGELLRKCLLAQDELTLEAMAANPVSTDVFVSTARAIYRVDPLAAEPSLEKYYVNSFDGGTFVDASWVAIDPTGAYLALGEKVEGETKGEGTQVVEIASGRLLRPILDMAGPMAFSPDGKDLYFANQRIEVHKLR